MAHVHAEAHHRDRDRISNEAVNESGNMRRLESLRFHIVLVGAQVDNANYVFYVCYNEAITKL